MGSEVHIDIYDDRLTIYSPGGMADGTKIQERDIYDVSSTRRNPVLADIFGRLGFMERQGSGFKKITDAYYSAHNFRKELEPKFYSDFSSFHVTLYNLNYNVPIETTDNEHGKVAIGRDNLTIGDANLAIEVAIGDLTAKQPIKSKALSVFGQMGFTEVFGRTEVAKITGDSVTSAGSLIKRLGDAGLIKPVVGQGKGKYKFTEPKK